MRKFFFIAALAALMCTATEAKAQTAAEVDATVAKVMSAKAPWVPKRSRPSLANSPRIRHLWNRVYV